MSLQVCVKEWARVESALAAGAFSALVRKGGIREQRAGFSVRHPAFLFYPTYFHENPRELAPRLHNFPTPPPPAPGFISFAHWASAVAVWRVTQLDSLRSIEDHHGMSWEGVQSRFNYRNNPLIHVVAVQVMRLPAPVLVPETRRYKGCVSWVRLDAPIDTSDSTPAAPPDLTARRVAYLQSMLGDPLPPESW